MYDDNLFIPFDPKKLMDNDLYEDYDGPQFLTKKIENFFDDS